MKIIICNELIKHIAESENDLNPIPLTDMPTGTPFIGMVDRYTEESHTILLSENGFTYPLQSVFKRAPTYNWTNSNGDSVYGSRHIRLFATRKP